MSERPVSPSLLETRPAGAAIVTTITPGLEPTLCIDFLSTVPGTKTTLLRYSTPLSEFALDEALSAFELYLTGRLTGVADLSLACLTTLAHAKRC